MSRLPSLWARLDRDRTWQNSTLVLVMLGVGLFLIGVSERIPLSQGLGFDGALYGQWAMHLDAVLDGSLPLTPYQALRILPSVLAHGTLRFLGAPLVPLNVIRFFEAYNLVLLCLAALAWGGAADALKLSWNNKIIGFIGLFLNHCVLKFNFYYPVLTDISGYTCAIFLLWAYLRHQFLPLAIVTLVGAFCWPPLLVYGAIALLFPRRDQPASPPATWFGLGAAIAVAGSYCLLAVTSQAAGVTPYYPLALTLVTAYLAAAIFLLFASPHPAGPMLLRAVSPRRLGVFTVTVALIILGRHVVAQLVLHTDTRQFFNQSLPEMVRLYLQTTCVPLSMRFPGEFLVAHVLYFGPLLFLTALFSKRAAEAAGRFGLGFLLLVLVSVLHAIMPLSRQWLVGYPIMVLITVLALEGQPLSRGFLLCFTAFSLFVSKVWMLFNLSRTPGVTDSGHDHALAWVPQFSFDHYSSSTGRWMSFEWYFTQGLLLAVALLFYYWYFYAPCAASPVSPDAPSPPTP